MKKYETARRFQAESGAGTAFAELNYADSAARSMAIWNELSPGSNFDAGWQYSIARTTDGAVYQYGLPAPGWTGVVSVSCSHGHMVALQMDGVVRAASVDSVSPADEILWWEDIIAISDGSSHTVALKKDGTVCTVGDKSYGQCDVAAWTAIPSDCVRTAR